MSTLNLRTHIVPVGFDPLERLIDPLIRYRADRVYLVSNFHDTSIAEANLKQARYALSKKLASCEVESVRTDIWDFFSCLEIYRTIFAKEKDNHLFVNVSTGSKIVSIAGMLSCMLWGGKPYYAKLDYSKLKSERKMNHDPSPELSISGVEMLPVYSIHQPTPESLTVLSLIKQSGGTISKKVLIEKLQSDEYKLIPSYGKDTTKSAPHSKLRAILMPLLNEWNFVSITSRGRRSDVKLTSQGLRALRIFGE